MEYRISGNNLPDMKHPLDVVFRAALYEVACFFKEFNFKLFINEETEVRIWEVIKLEIPLVFLKASVGNHIKTQFTVFLKKIY